MIERKLLKSVLAQVETPEAVVVTGMRRAGKTTLLRQVFDRLETKNKLFLDLENPLNQKYFEGDDYEAILYKLSALGLTTKERACVFLDEIQFCRNIPSVVKYFIDHHQTKFFLTGSASYYLKNLFSESLAGRKHLFELFPLDFEEFLLMKGSSLKVPTGRILSRDMYETFASLYCEYVEFGGFPGVVAKASAQEKRAALEEIFSSYFNKEVLQLGDFRKNQAVRDLMSLLMQRVGSRLDMQKLASELGISRLTLKDYLAFLEGTYFFSFVRPFSTSKDTEIRAAPKIYCVDSGFVHQLTRADFGHTFENALFHQLRGRGEINYYQRKSGVEIDFIVNREQAFEAKIAADERDSATLKRVAGELRMKEAHLVSYKYSEAKDVLYGFQVV